MNQPYLKLTLVIEQKTMIDNGFNRDVIVYRPTLTANDGMPCASGSLTFAAYYRWEDEEPEAHEEARKLAMDGARRIMQAGFIETVE